jgi:uncharacterized protein (DUF1778 family)
MATTRMELRLDKKLKAKVEKASALAGAKSTTEYVLDIMEKDANKVIAQYESITVKDDIFDQFIDACERGRKPGKALLDAAAFTKKQGIK